MWLLQKWWHDFLLFQTALLHLLDSCWIATSCFFVFLKKVFFSTWNLFFILLFTNSGSPKCVVCFWRQTIVNSVYFFHFFPEDCSAENAIGCLTSAVSLNGCRIFALPLAFSIPLSLLARTEHLLLAEERGLWNVLLALSSSCHLCQHSFPGLIFTGLNCC